MILLAVSPTEYRHRQARVIWTKDVIEVQCIELRGRKMMTMAERDRGAGLGHSQRREATTC